MMKELSGVYVITDSQLCPGRMHVEIAKAAIEGGAKVIQLRDKLASDREFYKAACEIKTLTASNDVLFIINDRVAIAAAVEADGVNIGQSDLPVSVVRKLLGKKALIGVSSDNPEQAKQAQIDGADYVGFGPIFTTTTKLDAGPVTGLETLRQVSDEVTIPVVAIGGIGLANIGAVAACGAACAAVVSAVVCAEDMVRATRDLVREFATA